MAEQPDPLVLELLLWVAGRPRTYAETMEAWRSSCPRHTPWEDALAAHLIGVTRVADADGMSVVLTTDGRAALEAASRRTGRGPLSRNDTPMPQ